jgi:DNA mismatch repair protein MutS
MSDKDTPLLKQYNQVKKDYPDTILLFRMGDFFETFNEDAVTTSKVCGIVLTKRHNGAAGECPLAGFPHHQLDAYLPKLVRAGYRVAVCEQLEDPKKARGIVRRGVVEVVTPGVALYDKLLETKQNNYVAGLYFNYAKSIGRIAGIAVADISTGEFFVTEVDYSKIVEVLEMLNPAEILISKGQKADLLPEIEKLPSKPAITKLEPWIFDVEFGRQGLLGQFSTQNLKGFGIEDYTSGLASAGAVLHYLKETQRGILDHIKKISAYNPGDYMTLDYATRRNLEITFAFSESNRQGTLISILDMTQSPMGGRLFKKWINMPLRKLTDIQKRQNAVRALFGNDTKRGILRKTLEEVGDLERLISRVCAGKAGPREMIALKSGLMKIPVLKSNLIDFEQDILNKFSAALVYPGECVEILEKALVEEPTTSLGNGGVFSKGYDAELDDYVQAKTNGRSWISQYQESERQRTGIPTLKVSYNSVFGYYIEITNAHAQKVPQDYQRKQTLTNAERYLTPELKEFESKILNAEEKILEIEQRLFSELLGKAASFTELIQSESVKIATLDCLQSFAEASRKYEYCEPLVDETDVIDIVEGRHPVVERLLEQGQHFIPNSTKLSPDGDQLHILTGPNMSGKSCYLRQVGLIILLAQIGCYVPAKSARIGIVDRIFTRVGAQDNITSGESTFLVEMQEAANILNNATNKSLILLDEVGRGTATFDGISIAWAIAEYIHDRISAKTLFATHYHEMNDLAERFDNIANYKVEVLETGGSVIFTHSVKPGASDHSFGIHVAQMAGLPQEIVERANEIMKTLEASSKADEKRQEDTIVKVQKPGMKHVEQKKSRRVPEQLSIFEFRDDELRRRILSLDLNNMTPVQSFAILSELFKDAGGN